MLVPTGHMQCTRPDGPKITLHFLHLFVCLHLNVGVFRYPLGGSTSTGRVEGLLACYEMLLALNQLHGQL